MNTARTPCLHSPGASRNIPISNPPQSRLLSIWVQSFDNTQPVPIHGQRTYPSLASPEHEACWLFNCAQLLILSKISEWVNERSLVSSISNIWIMPWLIALVVLPADTSPWIRYALLTGLLSYPYCHAILVAWFVFPVARLAALVANAWRVGTREIRILYARGLLARLCITCWLPRFYFGSRVTLVLTKVPNIRFVQAGNIISTNIYRDDDKPLCKLHRTT